MTTAGATRGCMRAAFDGSNIELGAVHPRAPSLVIQRGDLADAIAALQALEGIGTPAAQPTSDLHDRIGRLEALQQSGWSAAYDELVRTLTSEMKGLGIPGTSVESFGLVPAIKAALGHIKIVRCDLAAAAERDAARSDCELLRSMMFAEDVSLFDERPPRTRSCSACHAGAVPDPYRLAFRGTPVNGAPVTSVMAIVVGASDIRETVQEAHEIAIRAGRPVAFEFSGIPVTVNSSDDLEQVWRAWWQQANGCTPEQTAARR